MWVITLIVQIVLLSLAFYCWYKVGYLKAMNINLGATGHILNKLIAKFESDEIKTSQDANLALANCWEEWEDMVTDEPKLKEYNALYEARRKEKKGLTPRKDDHGTPGDFNQT